MKSIIASLLVLSVFGLMGPNAFSDVPDWVKNNAGWSADELIDDWFARQQPREITLLSL